MSTEMIIEIQTLSYCLEYIWGLFSAWNIDFPLLCAAIISSPKEKMSAAAAATLTKPL